MSSDISAPLEALKALQARVNLDGRHVYRVGGKPMPGVTSILKVLDKPALNRWMVNVQVDGTARAAYLNPPWQEDTEESYVSRLSRVCKELLEHERISKEASDIGTGVHRLIEHAVRGMLGEPSQEPEVPEESLFRFAGWHEWAKRVDLKPILSEARIFHGGLGYCGTLDLLTWVGGELAVIDWKPTEKIYVERRLQLAAYRYALETLGWPRMGGYVVCMPKDGGDISMVSVDGPGEQSYEAACESFTRCLALYRWLKAVEKRTA